jgi:anaerobic dimethyl sulfoxide reductase subunit C (anchor subunit)
MWSEWPLILFTLSIQMGVGLFCTGEALDWIYTRRYGFAGYRPIRIRVRTAAAALTGLGLITSFFHLGRPLKAVLALSNLKTSWLSREILLALVFASTVLFLLLIVRLSRAYRGLQWLISLLGGAAGILLIAAMSKIYMLPAVPGWNRITTPLSFFTDTLLLGGLAAAVLFLSKSKTRATAEAEQKSLSDWTKKFSRVSLVGAFLLLAVGSCLTWAIASGAQTRSGLSLLWSTDGQAGIVLPLRFLTALAGALMLLITVFKSRQTTEKGVFPWSYTAASVMILFSEVLARLYYYSLSIHGWL